ncbi:MAG: hypothetical protein ACREQ5_28545, partial [Candidatus Dormibacteria bacterium]
GTTQTIVCDAGQVAISGGGNPRVGNGNGGGDLTATIPVFVTGGNVNGDNSVTTQTVAPAVDGSQPNGWQLVRTSNGNDPFQVWVICVPGTPSASNTTGS